MKYRAPPDCSALSHGGKIYSIDATQTIEAGEGDAAALAVHGVHPDPGPDDFGPADDPPWKDIEAMTRGEIEAILRSLGAREPFPKHMRKLRSLLRTFPR